MSDRFEAFTIAEFEELMPSVYLMDDEGKNRIMEFVRDHCASRPGMMQLLICTAEMCASIARMIAARDGKDFDFVALETTEDTPAEMVTFGQVIAVTMNGDGDTQVALLRAMLDRAEESDDGFEVAAVAAVKFGLFSFLMHELADTESGVSG
jgi:hypothetical protein